MKVEDDDPAIDREQRECSRILRGLPLLDLGQEGSPCEQACRLICIVCGSPTAFPCEQEYSIVLDAKEKYEEEQLELRTEILEGMEGLMAALGERMLDEAERRFRRILQKHGMAWHGGWRKIVHAGCLKKLACGCMRPKVFTACEEHKRPTRKPERMKHVRPEPQQSVESKVPAPVVLPAKGPSRPIILSTNTWLPKPSLTATTAPVIRPAERAHTVSFKPKPAPRRPNTRLINAAKGCRKLETYNHASPQPPIPGHPGTRPKFDRARYEKEFDPFLHGYFRHNGVDKFRFPDGWVEQVYSPVNQLTDDGHLLPA